MEGKMANVIVEISVREGGDEEEIKEIVKERL